MSVISSPNWGVFAVTAAAPGPRRGHVIYSGVLAVAAVTAVGVFWSWSTPWLARRVRLGASRARWSAPVGGSLLLGRDILPGRGGRLSVPGDGHGSDRPGPRWAGAPLARRSRGGGSRGHPHRRHRSAWPAARYRLRRDHPPAAGEPLCSQLARALGLQRAHHVEDVPAGRR